MPRIWSPAAISARLQVSAKYTTNRWKPARNYSRLSKRNIRLSHADRGWSSRKERHAGRQTPPPTGREARHCQPENLPDPQKTLQSLPPRVPPVALMRKELVPILGRSASPALLRGPVKCDSPGPRPVYLARPAHSCYCPAVALYLVEYSVIAHPKIGIDGAMSRRNFSFA
jgi:hypothetical protein